jgi:para-aminobenzoate synthetase component I
MPLNSITLPYSEDAALKWFAKLADQPWAMLLSSGAAQHPDSRFDILTADPLTTLVTHGIETVITRAGLTYRCKDDPLRLLDEELQRLPTLPESLPALPFLGGALGLFGYDLGRRFERLPSVAKVSLHTADMAIGIYDWALIADHQLQVLTLVSLSSCSSRLQWLNEQVAVAATRFKLTSAWHSNLTKEAYSNCFDQIQAYIQAGDCYQINLAQRFHASYIGDEWQAFLHLHQLNKAPFSAFLRFEQSAILSLSPERFLQLAPNGQIETKPIKGTRPRGLNSQQDQHNADLLRHSSKDRAENLMIVDLLRNDIGRVASPSSVRVPSLFAIESFPAVHHLVSTVQATLNPALKAGDLIRACFPGGSITGAPKIRAMEIIDELEPHRRNAWCGSIGYLSRCSNMDSNIAIRTLTAEQNQLYCSAGGGIVADSVMDEEYQETLDKVARILPCLTEL